MQKGNFSTWQQNKQKTRCFEPTENEKLKREIKTLTAAAKKTADWSNKVEKTKR